MKRTGTAALFIGFIILVSCSSPLDGGGGGSSQAATPTFLPLPGLIQQDTELIEIACITASSIIHYTTNGSDPTIASLVYTAPLPASLFPEGLLTMKAMATAAGYSNSEIGAAAYTVTDTIAPTVVISSTASGGTNAPFDVTVTFNETVTGFDAGDIVLGNANPLLPADFTDANPLFTVHVTPAAIGTVTIDVADGVCTDTSIALNANSAAAQFSIYYDPNAPQAVIASATSEPTASSPIAITITFDRNVVNFDASDLTAANGTISNFAGSLASYSADVTPLIEGVVTVDIDSAVCQASLTGAPNIASAQFSRTYDGISPSVTLSSGAGDPTNADPIPIIMEFSEVVTGFAAGDLGVINGSAGNLQTADNMNFTADITPAGNGLVRVSLAGSVCTDLAGNANLATVSLERVYDGTSPSVSLFSSAPDPTTVYPIPVSINFSESVSGFSIFDITVGGGSAGNFSGSGSAYTIEITPTGAPEQNATVTVDIPGGVCTDTVGNGNSAATQLSRDFDGTQAGFITFQNASVVFGQPDFTSNASNQGGSVGANTYTQSFGEPAYYNGKLFLPDYGNNRVLVFNSLPTVNNANADFVIGQSSLTTNSSGLSSTAISGPESVSTNGTKLIIDDYGNNRILIYNALPTSSGAAADVVVGQTDFFSNSTGLSSTKINAPESAFISANKLFIADSVNNRVLIFNSIPASNGAAADLVLGQTDFTSNGAGTTATTMRTPTDVWSDGTKVIVSDAYNNRILIWNTFPTVNGQAADVVVGQADFTSNGAGTAANKFRRQWNFNANSGANQLFVTDLDNHRVLIFNTIPTANGASADAVLGQADFTTAVAGCTQSAINWPCGIYVIDSQRIIMIDANNNRALIFEGQ